MAEKKLTAKKTISVLAIVCVLLVASLVGILFYNNNAYANYPSTHNHSDEEYDALVSQIKNASSTIANLNDQISNLQSELAANSSLLASKTQEINNLQGKIVSLNKTATTLQDYYNSKMYVINTENHDIYVQLDTAKAQIAALQSQINSISNLTASTVWVNNQSINQPAGSSNSWNEATTFAGYVLVTVSSPNISSIYTNLTYSSHGINYNVQTNLDSNGSAAFPVLPSSNVVVTIGNKLATGAITGNVTIAYYY